jgi:hypothetical protein
MGCEYNPYPRLVIAGTFIPSALIVYKDLHSRHLT